MRKSTWYRWWSSIWTKKKISIYGEIGDKNSFLTAYAQYQKKIEKKLLIH